MSKLNPKAPVPVPGPSPMHSFSQVPAANIQRSKFDFSSTHKTLFDAGLLVPIFGDEVLPGDTWSMSTSMLVRFATLQAPIMDDVYLDLHWWFVPNRLIWDHWPNFMGEQLPNPGSSTDYTVPVIAAPENGFALGSLFDYLGYPVTPLTANTGTFNVDALECRAYNLIYNTWYRDQNLIDSVPQDDGDGPDNYTDYVLLRRGKRHDYFTSCLPWPQKGDAVTIPIGTTANIELSGNYSASAAYESGGTTPVAVGYLLGAQQVAGVINYGVGVPGQSPAPGADIGLSISTSAGGNYAWIDNHANLVADLSSAVGPTINALRQGIAVQQLLERDARGGTRLTEIIHSHFGVISPDARMQRPEFLGSSTGTVGIYSVPQSTPASGGSTSQAYLAAFGVATPSSGSWVHSFTEHGIVLGIISARARYTYTQGLRRGLSRQTRYDYYWPTFAMLGEQAVLSQEICMSGNSGTDQSVFGYQERWAEYRYRPSYATNLFRTNVVDALLQWTLAQGFASPPTLAQSFIQENPPTDQVVAVTEVDGPAFKADFSFTTFVTRPLPIYSVPGLLRL